MTQRPSRDRIVVSTSRCGRDNPGSNPGHGSADVYSGSLFYIFLCYFHFSICMFLSIRIGIDVNKV